MITNNSVVLEKFEILSQHVYCGPAEVVRRKKNRRQKSPDTVFLKGLFLLDFGQSKGDLLCRILA
jgi:hypothetical protein